MRNTRTGSEIYLVGKRRSLLRHMTTVAIDSERDLFDSVQDSMRAEFEIDLFEGPRSPTRYMTIIAADFGILC
jgi:hypothetical protein